MLYLNPAVYKGVVAVPAAFVEKGLKLASATQLKVLLAVCAHAGEAVDAQMISAMTGIKASEVADQLGVWAEKGLLIDDSAQPSVPVPEAAEPKEKADEGASAETPPAAAAPEIPEPELRPQKLSREQIMQRLTESAELRELMLDAQSALGRTIGHNDQSAFIILHDFYGLNTHIIRMICEYARLHGKGGNTSFIFNTGINWSKREIDTFEAAEEELKRLERTGETWEEFRKMTGGAFGASPTDKQRETADKWINAWKLSPEVIRLALEEMRNNLGDKQNVAYMDRILSKWYMAGAVTPEKIRDLARKHEADKLAAKGARNRTQPDADPNAGASYDIEKAVRRAETTAPTVKKRQKR